MKAHETVLQWVTEELASGRLHIGDHLPGERALAEVLGVSRGAIREALRVLEVLGSIQTATGSGPRSGTILTAAPGQGLSAALNLQLATRQVAQEDIVQVRLLLERWSAQHADPAVGEWEQAAQLLDRMDEPGLGIEAFLRLDAEFHAICSRAAGNPLISALMDALRLTIAAQTVTQAQRLDDWSATARRLQQEHRAILGALRAGRNADAAELLERHIVGYYREPSTRAEAEG